MHYGLKGFWILCLSYLIFSASTCVETAEPGPTAADFTKQKREQLGDILKETIELHPSVYPLLDRRSKRDSVILTYLQTLYDQATQGIRQDRQSTPSNRWTAQRKWQVVVLHDENKYAFSLPGGHFYISTGFLRSLSMGYEIYYLMAFEATNVSGRYLIDNLISEYGTSGLLDLVSSSDSALNSKLFDITQTLRNDLEFQDDVIREIDRKTGELICETSIFDRFGVQSILENLTSQEQWRDTRPSYANRLEYIHDLNIGGCGTIKSTGLYEKMVLKNLPK